MCPTLSFSGNEYLVQMVYLMPKTVEIMSSYGHRFFYFLVDITARKEIYLILSSFYFLERFLAHKTKISCFITKRPLKYTLYSAGPWIFPECSVADTHILRIAFSHVGELKYYKFLILKTTGWQKANYYFNFKDNDNSRY